MLRKWQWLILLGLATVLLAGGLGYWLFLAPKPLPKPEAPPTPLAGLDWLPAEAGLVARIDAAAIRQQEWFVQLLNQITAGDEVEKDYAEFVASTGFDYTRDLDQLWLGIYGSSETPSTAGVAEGRFDREKIIAHALKYGGRKEQQDEFDIYQVDDPVRPQTELQGSFAFAFLTENRIAFGSDAEQVRRVLETTKGNAKSAGSDPERRSRFEKIAAGRQAWAANDLSRWVPGYLKNQEEIASLLREIGGGIRIAPEGIRIEAFARCQEPAQAERLHDNLKLMLLAGRFMLGRNPNPLVRTMAKSLGEISLYQEESDLQAVLNLTKEEARELLLPEQEAARKNQ